MKKVFHLKTCSTCQRIIKSIDWPSDIEFQNIKELPIDSKALDLLAKHTGTYEALFNKRAMKYKQQDLKSKGLTEKDFKHLILEEYTFLKRPVVIYDGHYFVGNAASVVEEMQAFFSIK